MLLVQPAPADVALAADDVEAWIAEANARAETEGIRGAAVTPFVLAHVAAASGGRALRANVALIVANARMAARIAAELARRGGN
jgi:pseudouridine-5'-phosphate glycosidase